MATLAAIPLEDELAQLPDDAHFDSSAGSPAGGYCHRGGSPSLKFAFQA